MPAEPSRQSWPDHGLQSGLAVSGAALPRSYDTLQNLLRINTYSRRLPEIVLLALVYYFTARLGQFFAIPPGNVTPVWIPSGICLAVILVRGYALWPGIFLGAFAGNVWAYIDFQVTESIVKSVLTGTANGIGDVICAVGAAYLIQLRAGTWYPFKQAHQVLLFLVFGALLGPLVSAVFGVTSLCAAGFLSWANYSHTLLTWWTGDGVGVVVITPVLLALYFRDEHAPPAKPVTVALFLMILLMISMLSLGLVAPLVNMELPIFSLAPLLIMAAFKFSQRFVFLAIFIVASLTLVAGVRQAGPFIGPDLNLTLVQMQWFMALMAITILTVSGVVCERATIRRRLQAAHDELEGRVHERTVELRDSYLSLEREMAQRQEVEASRKELEGKLRQAQKLEAIGTLAGGIAHDFNNILMAMMGFTDLALDDAEPDSVQAAHLREIQRSQLRARDLIKRILLFARRSDTAVEPVDLGQIASETVDMLRGSLPSSIDIRLHLDQKPVVEAEASQIVQMIMNLCTNSYRAMRSRGGRLEIRLSEVTFTSEFMGYSVAVAPGDYARLTVSDTGEGIKGNVLERIFDPFYTTTPSGEGTGMGLPVVLGVVQAAGGTITVESTLGEGTCIDIYLPLSVSVPDRPAAAKTKLASGTENILFVDDEVVLVNLASRALGRLGYKVTGFSNSTEALAHFEADPAAFDLVITDLTMPVMNGQQLARAIAKIRPDLPIIMCSGYTDQMDGEDPGNSDFIATMSKPMSYMDLSASVRQALDFS